MPGTVAVAPDLGPFAEALRDAGLAVVGLPPLGDAAAGRRSATVRADVIVVTGLGGHDAITSAGDRAAAVVDAAGKTPAQVVAEVKAALGAHVLGPR